ncbi:hypothetical protein [Faecalicatena contorta]|uniref:hypothetical protein n=1 Tax=Faecalicatena contorta TaxID=39482 RepID=UPI001F22ABD1|nr:hypothetical protein [Faecalicatena contorta]MCF2681859.1 hypothetical protein [Faecalicatena contorta]
MTVVHEIGHAIERKYGIYNDQNMKELFEKYKEEWKTVFENDDIHEFIAIGFMVSELVKDNQVANKIREIINERLK